MAFGTQNSNEQDPSSGSTSVALLNTLHAVDKAVTGLTVKIDSMTEGLSRDRAEGADHEARIRRLEQRMWYAMGMSAGLAAGATTVLSKLFGI